MNSCPDSNEKEEEDSGTVGRGGLILEDAAVEREVIDLTNGDDNDSEDDAQALDGDDDSSWHQFEAADVFEVARRRSLRAYWTAQGGARDGQGIAVKMEVVEDEEAKECMIVIDDDDGDGDGEADCSQASEQSAEEKQQSAPRCCCSYSALEDARTRRLAPCVHLYCLEGVRMRSRLDLRDRTLVAVRSCQREFPLDYVKDALTASEFALYERFVREKHWTALDLESDREYARVVRQNGCTQCPGCGIGVLKVTGCNHKSCLHGHTFCFLATTSTVLRKPPQPPQRLDQISQTSEKVRHMAGVWHHHHQGDAAGGVANEQQQQYMAEALKPMTQGRFASDAIEVDDDGADDLERLVSEVYALEMHREELRLAEQLQLDEAIAISLAEAEERELLGQSDDDDDDDGSDRIIIDASDLESKPAPSCTCCLAQLDNERTRRILPCGHLYCLHCITTRAGMSVRDRTLLPAHCCRKEFPIDYVKEALKPSDFALYERFLKEKHWTSLDLQSDKEYAHAAKQNGCKQCPGCGIGVSKISGCNRMKCCNGHEFCFDCGKAWKTCPCYYPGGGY